MPRDEGEEVYLQAVQSYYRRQFNEAVARFTEAIRRNPRSAEAYYGRGNAYYNHQKQYDKAIADYSQGLRLDPEFVDLYSCRGNAYYNLKQYDKAIADFSEACA